MVNAEYKKCHKHNIQRDSAISVVLDTICSKPQEIDYGSVTYDGETAIYECDSGYTLEGNSNLTCNDGIWIPDPPTCIKSENKHTAICVLCVCRCNANIRA